MASPPSELAAGVGAEATDAQLLAMFLNRQDQSAFDALMQRHAVMVMGLLRRLGLQQADADDAFQATFLTLVRKGSSINKAEALGGWLYKVAYRIGLELREKTKKRQAKEQPLSGGEQAAMAKNLAEFWALLDAEVMDLPEKYRVPFVLCHLQGMPLEQAAKTIGCPIGTVGTRLAKVRELLRTRLAKRGLVLSAAVLTAFLMQLPAQAAAPTPAVMQQTLDGAVAVQAGVAATVVSAQVLALSDKAVWAFVIAKIKFVALVAAAAVVITGIAGTVALAWPQAEAPQANWLITWGTVVDPDRDSKFTATKKTLKVHTPGAAHVLVDASKHNGPRIERGVQGDVLIQVKVAAVTLAKKADEFQRDVFAEADKPNPLNTAAFHGAGIVLLQDENNFVKVQRGAIDTEEGPQHYLLWHQCIDGQAKAETALVSAPYSYLRLQRLGPHVFASGSADGERWESFPALTHTLAESLRGGLVIEHNSATGMDAMFSDYKVTRFDYDNNPQPPWQGPPEPRGCAKCHAGLPPAPAPGLRFRFPLRGKEAPPENK